MKKLYYRIDNGDHPVIMELSGCMELIKNEMEGYNEEKTIQEEPFWNISPVWLTDEEFENLPDAY